MANPEIANTLRAIAKISQRFWLTLDSADNELRRVSLVANQTLRFYRQSSSPIATKLSELLETVLTMHHWLILTSHISLNFTERNQLERLYGVGGGIVLDFTNRTFQEFVFDCSGVASHCRFNKVGRSSTNAKG